VRSFGAAVSDFTPWASPHHFDVLHQGEHVAARGMGLTGVHNQLNALAAIAAAEHVGVAPAIAAQALGTFQNVKRRMEVRGTVNGITVYDDFAHHPTAIRTTLDGLRRASAARAHPGRVRAAQQHHEARRHEAAAALEPGRSRPGLLPQRRAGLGRRARRWPRMGARAQVANTIDALVAQVTTAARPATTSCA
jgi:UDP-N-acetylmuramate: L-alanyl-gamma-D-glutamyl-meso-diaminopimelate ligase